MDEMIASEPYLTSSRVHYLRARAGVFILGCNVEQLPDLAGQRAWNRANGPEQLLPFNAAAAVLVVFFGGYKDSSEPCAGCCCCMMLHACWVRCSLRPLLA